MTDTDTDTSIKVGDIFYTSWGYDQTNVDFYEVVGLTPSGKSVKLHSIAATSFDGRSRPCPGVFTTDVWGTKGKTLTRRLTRGYQGRPTVKITDHRWASPYDLDENSGVYSTWASGGAGH